MSLGWAVRGGGSISVVIQQSSVDIVYLTFFSNHILWLVSSPNRSHELVSEYKIAGHWCWCQCWWPGAVSWHSRNAGHRHGSARGGGMGTLDTLDTLDITIDIYLGRYLDKGQLVEQTRTALHISGDLWQSASVAVRHVSDVSQCSAWRVQDSQNEPSFIVSEIHVAH